MGSETESISMDIPGKKGIGLGGKRARSPTATERLAKMAKMADDMEHRDFRDRARDEYKNRQAEGRLSAYTSAKSWISSLHRENEIATIYISISNTAAFALVILI